MTIDRILFGDNQFFGVNHLSDEKSRAQAMRFGNTEAIMEVLGYVIEADIKSFMCTTHDRIAQVCEQVRSSPQKFRGFKFLPGMPYAHKYANAVTELGVVGALKQYVPGNLLTAFGKGGIALARKDFMAIMQLLVDSEMKMFNGLDVPVIFLQNVITDLLLGLGMKDIFVAFSDYVKNKYNSEAGFITMNLPHLYETLQDCGLRNTIICASINTVGFRMAGGKDLYEAVLRKGDMRAIAMQVFAGGAVPPRQALEYVCNLSGISSIVFGASSKAHIEQTKAVIGQYWDLS